MWTFWRKTGIVPLTEKIRLSLKNERGLSDEAAAPLRMLTEGGQHERHAVTFFRVFDPTPIRWTGLRLRRYDNLALSSVVHGGYIEPDGTVVLTANPIPSVI